MISFRFPPRRVLALSLAVACAPASIPPAAEQGPQPEAYSLAGVPLYPPAFDAATRARLQADLEAARAAHARAPDDADAIIWLGRRHAYLGQYRAAVDVFTQGIAVHPADARLYRHRGHRYITLRRFEDAIRDLEHAARLTAGSPDEVEPDGAPNAHNIPVSTLQTNIWYHLALAHYLSGDFEAALPAWQRTLELSANDDMRVAAADWLYMTLRRLGRDAQARAVLTPIQPEMRILENHAYHRRLLMYRGELGPEDLLLEDGGDAVQLATYGYGVANWYLYNGDAPRARSLFERILQGQSWAAFGFIAAEAELARP